MATSMFPASPFLGFGFFRLSTIAPSFGLVDSGNILPRYSYSDFVVMHVTAYMARGMDQTDIFVLDR